MAMIGFDTATALTTAALLDDDGRVAELVVEPDPTGRPAHALTLLGLCEKLLARGGIGWPRIDRVAVGLGPGSFTGLRIGVSTARAVAQSCGAQLIGVSSLAVVVEPAQTSGRVTLAVLDAGRGEVFAAGWLDGEPVLDRAVLSPERLAERISGFAPSPLTLGAGAIRFRETLQSAGAVIPVDGSPLHRISAACLCRLATRATATPRDALRPDYGRAPDARPPKGPSPP